MLFHYLSPSTFEAIFEDLLETFHEADLPAQQSDIDTVLPLMHLVREYYDSLTGESLEQIAHNAYLKRVPQAQQEPEKWKDYYFSPLNTETE